MSLRFITSLLSTQTATLILQLVNWSVGHKPRAGKWCVPKPQLVQNNIKCDQTGGHYQATK